MCRIKNNRVVGYFLLFKKRKDVFEKIPVKIQLPVTTESFIRSFRTYVVNTDTHNQNIIIRVALVVLLNIHCVTFSPVCLQAHLIPQTLPKVCTCIISPAAPNTSSLCLLFFPLPQNHSSDVHDNFTSVTECAKQLILSSVLTLPPDDCTICVYMYMLHVT